MKEKSHSTFSSDETFSHKANLEDEERLFKPAHVLVKNSEGTTDF